MVRAPCHGPAQDVLGQSGTRCRASLRAASQAATWLYAAGEEAGEGTPWYAPGKEPATLAVCVQDLEGCECDLEERELWSETELRQSESW